MLIISARARYHEAKHIPVSAMNPFDDVSDYLKSLQDRICAGLEAADGSAVFAEDGWQRPEGGGGRSRVLKKGAVFEQAGAGY